MVTYQQEVADAIKQSGLTLHQIGRKIGSHKGYISGIQNGKVAPPSAKMTRRLAKILGLNGDRLVALALIEKRPRKLGLQALRNVVDELIDSEAKEAAAEAELAAPPQKEAS